MEIIGITGALILGIFISMLWILLIDKTSPNDISKSKIYKINRYEILILISWIIISILTNALM
jgi:hypothetical protein